MTTTTRVRRLAAPALAATLIAASAVVAPQAASASALCSGTPNHSKLSDYAWSTGNGECYQVGVRHNFNPQGSISVTTGWSYGSNYAQTGSAAELRSSEHIFFYTSTWSYTRSL